MSRLIEDLASYRPFRAIVVGDFMLDQSVYGAAERLSPDAPVPVLHADRTENHPGGAANVAICLRELKAEVACIGVVGGDPEAETLREAIVAAGCEVDGLLADPSRPTTINRSRSPAIVRRAECYPSRNCPRGRRTRRDDRSFAARRTRQCRKIRSPNS